MVIAENRDAGFWLAVAEAPECAGALFGAPADMIAQVVADPGALPLATENGGLVFLRRDGMGRVFELHTLYRREGWGAEVHAAAREAFDRVFETADLVVTHECVDNWRSRPPRSFGFRPAGPVFANHIGEFRTWILTRGAWLESPARTRWKAH